MSVEEIKIKCSDGFLLAGTIFKPEKPPAGVIVIASAMGVPKKFYHPFAGFLSDNGIASLTFDYRGVGDSYLNGLKGSDIRLEDWGRLDIDAALREAAGYFGKTPLYLLGHSCGGQLFGIAPFSDNLSGVIFISAQLPNSRYWPVPYNLAMLAMWHMIIPALCFRRNIFPARRLGLSSTDVPAGVTSQWARWARQPGYLFNDKFNLDTSNYHNFSFPLLAWIFDDDIYAPEKSVRALLARMPGTDIEIKKINGRYSGLGRIGHFGFFREKMRNSLWPEIPEWILSLSDNKKRTRS